MLLRQLKRWTWILLLTANTSGYKLYIEETGKILISNQIKFDENLYPYRNCDMVSQHLYEIAVVDVMSLDTGEYD
jgi:hypothetical protein